MRTVLPLSLCLFACTRPVTDPAAASAPVPLENTMATDEHDEPVVRSWRVDDARVEWSHAQAEDSCFFFTGPLEFGREETVGDVARLRATPGHATLDMGMAHFEGRFEDSKLDVKRTRAFEYAGTQWTTTERIKGTLVRDVLEGTYEYQECDELGMQGCPSQCVLTLRFSFAGVERYRR